MWASEEAKGLTITPEAFAALPISPAFSYSQYPSLYITFFIYNDGVGCAAHGPSASTAVHHLFGSAISVSTAPEG